MNQLNDEVDTEFCWLLRNKLRNQFLRQFSYPLRDNFLNQLYNPLRNRLYLSISSALSWQLEEDLK